MLNFIMGGAGSGKSTNLMSHIKDYTDAQKDIIVIVPEQFSFEFDRKLYKSIGAKAHNNAVTYGFTTLARDIFLQYGGRSGEYADEMTKTVLMYMSVSRLNDKGVLNFYRKQAGKVQFIESAQEIITELRRAGIAPDTLYEKISFMENQVRDKVQDISLIYTEYDRLLNEMNYKDSLTDITEAAAIANMNDFFSGKVVFIDEFENFTGDQLELLDVIIAQCSNMFMCLRTENENDNKASLFEAVNKTYRRLSYIADKYNVECKNIYITKSDEYRKAEILEHISKNILRPVRPILPHISDNNNSVKIIECHDLYQEVDYVCTEIRRLVFYEGYNYRDIAIVSRQIESYASIFEAAFERYEISYFMDMEKSVMHTSIMLLIISILDIVITDKPNTETILRYLKTQLLGISYGKISMLENYCYEWGVDGEMWFSPFTVGDDENIEAVEELRLRLITPIIELKNKCKDANGKQICKAIYEHLVAVEIPINISGLAQYYKDNNFPQTAKELKRLWGKLMDMLDVLAETLGDNKILLNNFRELFISMLKQNAYSVPPQSLDAVTVAAAHHARLNSPKIIFVLGINEGNFPCAVKVSGLLNDKDKNILESVGLSLSRTTSDLLADERLVVYKTLSVSSEKMYLSYPLTDNQGGSRYPSFVIEQIENMLYDNIKIHADRLSPVYFSSSYKAGYYQYVQNFSKCNSDVMSIRKALESSEFYNSRVEFLDSLTENKDFIFEDKSLVHKIFSERLQISATKFENYNQCHFKFFCENGLKIKNIVRREINPLSHGNIVHYCMEKILSSCHTKEEFDALDRKTIENLVCEHADNYKKENLGGNFGKGSRFNVEFRRIIDSIVELILHTQQELKQSLFRPVDFELAISENNGDTPIKLRTNDGIEVILNGKIDRVDMYESNGRKFVRIIDYKTGKKENISFENIFYGIEMQMLLYIFSITEPTGKFASSVPAGILYLPAAELSAEVDRKDKKDVEVIKNSEYKMKGIVLKNREVLNAMNEYIDGVYIPAKLLKADDGQSELILDSRISSCLSENQFENLRKYAKKLIIDMAEELYNGNISASPLIFSEAKSVCNYCDFWDVCGNVPNIRCRVPADNAKDVMQSIIDGNDEKEGE